MEYLLGVILLNTVISVIFKVYPKYKVDTFQAIVVNYFVCVATGSLFIGKFPISNTSLHKDWLPYAMLMGLWFISVFSLFGYCTRISGITTATIANKLSLVIPAALSIYLYNEPLNAGKLIGIALAIPAVYLTTKTNETSKASKYLLLPILIFILSGLLDAYTKYVQHHFLTGTSDEAAYTTHVFATAGIVGTIVIIFLAITKKIQLHYRNIIAGICLGIPNYFSIYWLIKLLNSNFLHSSAAIPITNIGIVVSSTLTAILFFKEKASIPRIIGLILAIAAILLIGFNGRDI